MPYAKRCLGWVLIALCALAALGRAAPKGSTSATIAIKGPFDPAPAAQTWVSELAGQSPVAALPQPSFTPSGVEEQISWQRFDLSSPDGRPGSDLWFVTNASVDRRLDAFLFVDDQLIDSTAAGYSVPIEYRKIAVSKLALSLSKWTSGKASVYLRYHAPLPRAVFPKIQTTDEVLGEYARQVGLDFAYFGAFGLIMVMRAILFASFRDAASRDYLLLSIGLMLGVVSRAGYWDLYLAQQFHTPLTGDFRFLIRTVNCILILRSLNSYFDLRRTAPGTARLIRFSIWVFLGLIVIGWFSPQMLAIVLAFLAQFLAILVVAWVCLIAIRRKLTGAVPSAIGWSGIVLILFLVTFVALGILPPLDQDLITEWTVFALIWEGTVNTAALTYRFRQLKVLEHLAALRQQQSVHRQQLIRLMSHDVLNPASVIKNSVWLLRRGAGAPLGEATQRSLAMIERAVEEINEITSRVRALEPDSGACAEMKAVNVVPIIESAIESFRLQAEAKDLAIATRFEGKELLAWADSRLLASSVLANSLSNAIKFSHRGGKIEVGVTSTRENVIITVVDHGVGIPAEHLASWANGGGAIASSLGTSNERGRGFGLQIMHHVCHLMGGDMKVHSSTATQGKGPGGTAVVISLRSVAGNV